MGNKFTAFWGVLPSLGNLCPLSVLSLTGFFAVVDEIQEITEFCFLYIMKGVHLYYNIIYLY